MKEWEYIRSLIHGTLFMCLLCSRKRHLLQNTQTERNRNFHLCQIAHFGSQK